MCRVALLTRAGIAPSPAAPRARAGRELVADVQGRCRVAHAAPDYVAVEQFSGKEKCGTLCLLEEAMIAEDYYFNYILKGLSGKKKSP